LGGQPLSMASVMAAGWPAAFRAISRLLSRPCWGKLMTVQSAPPRAASFTASVSDVLVTAASFTASESEMGLFMRVLTML
jgi:hypothetical protein